MKIWKSVLRIICLGSLAAVLACSHTKPQSPAFQCSDYDWESVQSLVFPFLDATMQTAMIMQGQSAAYKISMAADFALAIEESYPDSVVRLLEKMEGC